MGNGNFGAEDRGEARSFALSCEVHCTEHVVVIRKRYRGHVELAGALDEVREPNGAVQHRILRVVVEVDEARRHRGRILPGWLRLGKAEKTWKRQ
jgi:hypothetical protein